MICAVAHRAHESWPRCAHTEGFAAFGRLVEGDVSPAIIRDSSNDVAAFKGAALLIPALVPAVFLAMENHQTSLAKAHPALQISPGVECNQNPALIRGAASLILIAHGTRGPKLRFVA